MDKYFCRFWVKQTLQNLRCADVHNSFPRNDIKGILQDSEYISPFMMHIFDRELEVAIYSPPSNSYR